jgi:hypothetical protein
MIPKLKLSFLKRDCAARIEMQRAILKNSKPIIHKDFPR